MVSQKNQTLDSFFLLQISVTLWLRGWQRSAADLAILLKSFVWLRPSIDMNGN